MSQTRDRDRADVGRARRTRSVARPPASVASASARRPGRRLRAEHPRDARRVPRRGVARRRLVERRTRVRRPLGDRPVQPDRAGRCWSRSTATSTARSGSSGRGHVAEIVGALPTLRHVVHVPYLDVDAPLDVAGPDVVRWDELTAPDDGELAFTAVPADHPLYVLFSSGTTGLPKAIVHGHGGIVAEHLKVLTFHQDLGPGDRFFWFSTTGWMMWNYCVSGLLVGSAVVLFDGDPGAPDLGDAVAHRRGHRHHGVRRVGTVPHGVPQGRARSRAEARCRWVGSTGSPLPADGFRWVAEAVGVPRVVDLRRHRRLHRVHRFVTAAGGARRRDRRTAARLRGRGVRARRHGVPARRHRRARDHATDAVDAGRVLGRRRRLEVPRRLLRGLPGRVAPRRLGDVHRRRRRASSPAAPTRRSTAAACGSARATSIPSSRRCPRSPTASSCTSRTTATPVGLGELILFVTLAPGATLDDELRGRDPPGPRDRAVAAAHPRRDRGRAGRAAHAVGQEARAPGEAHPRRARPGERWRHATRSPTRRRSTTSWPAADAAATVSTRPGRRSRPGGCHRRRPRRGR